MRDWADDFTDEIFDGISKNTLSKNIVAMKLRALKIEAQMEAIRETAENIRHNDVTIGGGDK